MASHFYEDGYKEEFCIPNCKYQDNKDLCSYNCEFTYSYEEYIANKHQFYLSEELLNWKNNFFISVVFLSFICNGILVALTWWACTLARNARERDLADAEAQAHAIAQAHAQAHAAALNLPQPQWPVVGYVIDIPNEQENQDEGIEVYSAVPIVM
jgi:hypothetical protein